MKLRKITIIFFIFSLSTGIMLNICLADKPNPQEVKAAKIILDAFLKLELGTAGSKDVAKLRKLSAKKKYLSYTLPLLAQYARERQKNNLKSLGIVAPYLYMEKSFGLKNKKEQNNSRQTKGGER